MQLGIGRIFATNLDGVGDHDKCRDEHAVLDGNLGGGDSLSSFEYSRRGLIRRISWHEVLE